MSSTMLTDALLLALLVTFLTADFITTAAHYTQDVVMGLDKQIP